MSMIVAVTLKAFETNREIKAAGEDADKEASTVFLGLLKLFPFWLVEPVNSSMSDKL